MIESTSMVDMKKFVDLPLEVQELILNQLSDPRDICNVSVTCKRLNQVIDLSDRLMKKLTIYVQYPYNNQKTKDDIVLTKRRYHNLIFTRTRLTGCPKQAEDLIKVFAVVGPVVKHITINWCHLRNMEISPANLDDIASRHRLIPEIFFSQAASLSRNFTESIREKIRNELHKDFISFFKHFTDLETAIWNNVYIDKRSSSTDLMSLNFKSIKHLIMRHCDGYCFEVLSSATNLYSLEILEPLWAINRYPIDESFDLFLATQEALKILTIKSFSFPRVFNLDTSDLFKFKLHTLEFKNVFFMEKEYAENFFKKQDQLQYLKIQLQNERIRNIDELNWYNEILQTVLKNNSMLKVLNIDKLKYKIPNCEFLRYIRNRSVESLNFKVTFEESDAELFKMLVNAMPNLKSITYKSEKNSDDGELCFDKGTVLQNAETLLIINASVKSLINLYAEKLHTFECAPKLNGSYIDNYLGGFLHRHRNIKVLKIGSSNGPSYFFVSFNLCQIIVDFLNQLESITVYNFAEVNKSVKLLCTLPNLKTLTLSSVQYQQFGAKTKVECDRMKLTLIPVDVNHKQDLRELYYF